MGMSFPGHMRLLGPSDLLENVYSPGTFFSWHHNVVVRRAGTPWDSEKPCVARVNHGRWVATCPWCDAKMLTSLEWGVAYCAECGARYGAGMVEFPDEASEIERLLCRRAKRETQNWKPGETIEDLIADNVEHGVV